MHPQLGDKRIVCREFIQALEACHASTWARLTGGCNREKDVLNKCLREERLRRSAQNREKAKEARLKAARTLKDILGDPPADS